MNESQLKTLDIKEGQYANKQYLISHLSEDSEIKSLFI